MEGLFEGELIVLTDAEKKMIKTIRDKNIAPDIVLKKLNL